MTVHAKGLDHVAIVVRDLDESIQLWRDALGLELAHVEEVPEQQVRTAIFGHGMGRVELISPTTADSGVARFLASRGEGLHHVCIEVEDIEAAMESLRKAGAPLIDKEPRPGAGGARVAFVHPKGMRGVLTELRQGPADGTAYRSAAGVLLEAEQVLGVVRRVLAGEAEGARRAVLVQLAAAQCRRSSGPRGRSSCSATVQSFCTAYTEHASPNWLRPLPQAPMTASRSAAPRDSRGIRMLRFMFCGC